ncbi:hypothetical protein N7456_000203 [Penicillium angulare]|uniref:Major facilitator superfamily (MFS) profile domain-containing protein n=1 Tax=Penicillium angulare TaxID=116970 RepID=A0A9W9GCK2_9EURO|nr:hypothetical protein N7456_000203 [Penicillium angulare]
MATEISDEKDESCHGSDHFENKPDVDYAHGEEDILYESKGIKSLIRSPYILGACVLAACGGLSFGYDQGVISLILVMDQFRSQYPEVSPENPHYGFNTGLMTGMLELGAFLGCLLLPAVADRYSRKRALAVATVFFCVGAIIQSAAPDYATLVAGRAIGGVGVGSMAMGAPLYISEVAPPNLRGSLLVMEFISIVIGATLSYWITYGTRAIESDWAFRLPFVLQMLPALIVGIGLQFFPYSPRWLAMRERDQDCLLALQKLRRLPETDHRIQAEWNGIISEVKFQKEMKLREYGVEHSFISLEIKEWASLFSQKYFRQTVVALGVNFFQQFSGICAFVYYAPTFILALGQSYEMSLILSGMINVCQFVGVIPTFFHLDQMGRRKIAIFGGIAMSIPHFVVSGIVGRFEDSWSQHKAMGWVCIAFIYLYVLTYAVTYGPLAWALPAEIFPSHKRAKGVGAAAAMNWLANFIVGVVVPQMLISLRWGTYLFFGCFCLAASVFSFFLVPETAGKSLEQVAVSFGANMGMEEEELRNQIANQVHYQGPLVKDTVL